MRHDKLPSTAEDSIMHQTRGFTLIELMVVVAIVAIVASIAVPSYMNQVRKSRRADAIAVLAELRLKEESYRANNPSYAALATLGTPSSNYYTFTIADVTATTYTATATAISSTSQASDTGCSTLSLNQAGAVVAGNASCFSK